MKPRKIIASLIVMIVLFVSGCSAKTPQMGGEKPEAGAEQKTVEFRLAHFFPSTHSAETDLIKPWAQEIEKATDGKIKIISYPGESLLPAAQIYDGVVSGIADIGLSCFAYTRGRFPVSEVFELPGIIYKDSKAASQVAWEGIKELNPKEVQDTKLLMVLSTGSGDIYTKIPVRKLADLKGLEIRATGLSAKTLQALGAMPVAMPQSEAYESLSKNIVKGNLGPVEVLKGWKQAEVTKFITKTPFLYNTLFFITMNKDKWNSLDAKTQQVITDISEKYFAEVACGLWDKQNEDAMVFAGEKGMELIELTAGETESWIKLVEPIQQEFVANMNALGLEGQQILDLVKDLAAKYE